MAPKKPHKPVTDFQPTLAPVSQVDNVPFPEGVTVLVSLAGHVKNGKGTVGPRAGMWIAVDNVYRHVYLNFLKAAGLTLGEMKKPFMVGDQPSAVNGYYEIVEIPKEEINASS